MMASIIKNQILKHLSKFTKNLSSDQLNLSTLKGVGDLTNLELNEQVLMELLDLPSWLRLTKAICNHVSVKIQWTKLKSQPICLYLDEILIEMETCDELRSPASTGIVASYSSYSGGSKYGFSEKVIDGMYVLVNSITINFTSYRFYASIEISKVRVQSTNASWQVAPDLRATRIRNPEQTEVVIFKEIEWQSLRVVANAVDPALTATPVRLITNRSRLRVAIKKRTTDCGIVTSRLQLLLDDLLWVLTDAQLKATMVFVKSLSGIIEKAAQRSKSRAALHELLAVSSPAAGYYGKQVPTSQIGKKATEPALTAASVFRRCDIIETSYHLYIGKLDIHLCEEGTPSTQSLDLHSKELEGGAIQILLHKLSMDAYPFHTAENDRKHWVCYKEDNKSHKWSQNLLNTFKQDMKQAVNISLTPSSDNPGNSPDYRLMSVNYVLRIGDFIVHTVTANNRKSSTEKFFHSDKSKFHLQADVPAIHAEYVEYYFPSEESKFPVPPSSVHVNLSPIKLRLDVLSTLWINTFLLNVRQSVDIPENAAQTYHKDICIEALHPRIVIPSDSSNYPHQDDRPSGIQLQVSTLTITNCRVASNCQREDLKNALASLSPGKMHTHRNFPNDENDMPQMCEKFFMHSCSQDSPFHKVPAKESDCDLPPAGIELGTQTFVTAPCEDMWAVSMDFFWIEFIGVPSAKGRPVSFLEALPATVWVYGPSVAAEDTLKTEINSSQSLPVDHVRVKSTARCSASCGAISSGKSTHSCQPGCSHAHVLVHIKGNLLAQLNHYQYVVLLRIAESWSSLQKHLEQDRIKITKADDQSDDSGILHISMSASIVNEIEMLFVLPSFDSLKRSHTQEDLGSKENLLYAEDNKSPAGERASPSPVGRPESRMKAAGKRDLLDSFLAENPPMGTKSCPAVSRTFGDPDKAKQGAHHATMPEIHVSTVSTAKSQTQTQTDDSWEKEVNAFNAPLPIDPSTPRRSASAIGKFLESKTSFIKQTLLDSNADEDDLDAQSIHSDISDNYAMVLPDNGLGDDGLFANDIISMADTCSIARDESTDTMSSDRKTDSVTVLAVRLVPGEIAFQSSPSGSVFKLQASKLHTEELFNFSLEELQNRLAVSREHYSEAAYDGVNRIKLRLEDGKLAERSFKDSEESGFLQISAANINLSLKMSSVMNFLTLLEDELPLVPMPAYFSIQDVSMLLKEDRSASSLPTALHVHRTIIVRDIAGVLHVSPPEDQFGKRKWMQEEKDEVSSLTHELCRARKEKQEVEAELKLLKRDARFFLEELSIAKEERESLRVTLAHLRTQLNNYEKIT